MTDSTDRKDPETLKRMLPGTEGLERIRILADICVAFKSIDPHRTIEFGKQGLELLRSVEDKKLESIILRELSWANQCVGECKAALDYALMQLNIAVGMNSDSERVSAFNSIGVAYWRMTKYDRALEYYLKALRILENTGKKRSIGMLYNNVGIIYYEIGNSEKALDYYNRSIRIQEELDNRHSLANSLNNAGCIYQITGEYEKALEYHRRVLDIREQLGEGWRIAHSLNNIGHVLKDLKEYDKSLEYFSRALEMEEEAGDRHEAADSLLNIGRIYVTVGRFPEACEYAEKGLLLAEELGVPDMRRDCCETFSTILEQKGDFRQALEYYKKFKALNDEIFTEKNSSKINELQIQYETEKKDKEKEIYKLRNVELSKANEDLKNALAQVKHLSGLLPICASCKKIRDDNGYWKQIESYISEHSEALFSHALCPECLKMLYPEYMVENGEAESI